MLSLKTLESVDKIKIVKFKLSLWVTATSNSFKKKYRGHHELSALSGSYGHCLHEYFVLL